MTERLWTRKARLAPAAGLVLALVACAARADERDLARQILDATGTKGGLVVHVGCGDGKLTAALFAVPPSGGSLPPEGGTTSFLVHGLDTDGEQIDAARARLRSLGIYGGASVDRFDGRSLPYADNLVNLLVAEDLGTVPMAEVMRVLAPAGAAYVKTGGEWTKTVKPRPQELDEWTHYLHDATNNAVSADTAVGLPRRYQWIAGPRWARSHDHLASTSALVSAGGRVFYIVDEGPIAAVAIEPKWFLVARDAFSGVLLWKRPVGPWEGHLRGFRSGPTELARRLVAVGDRVYVTLGYGKPVSQLDAATGETIRQYGETAGALEIILADGKLFVAVGDRPPDNTGGAAKPFEPENVWNWWPVYEETPPRKRVVAIAAASGELLWKKDDADTAEMMPTTLSAAQGRVFFQGTGAILALDAGSGRELWRCERPVNRRRPSWSAPTLVVYGGVVLSGDRAVDAPPPGVPESPQPSQWVVNSQGGVAPTGQIVAFSAATGERLWESECRECYNAPVDVLVAGGLVWSGDLVSRNDPGMTAALDVLSGEVARTRPNDQTFFKIGMGHHRCYRNKATEEFLVLGRDGIELVDLDSGEGFAHPWVRGTCQYGVMPANGLIYSPPHSCACHIESKLNSFNALATARDEGLGTGDEGARLERGPAYGRVQGSALSTLNPQLSTLNPQPSPPTDWPTYRHDPARSGRGSCTVPAALGQAWETVVPGGRLSSPVVAEGKVFVAAIDEHAVYALDAESGRILWSFTAGGRVDSPPTIDRRAAIFGSADGWIYCLDAADGRLAWRFRAAPEDRRIVSYDQLESAWPVHGSVLVTGGTVYAVAGRTPELDGGMVLVRLDAATGELLSETAVSGPALPDVLSCDGDSVYLRHKRFDLAGGEQPADVPHLYSPAGFLDDSWWHRTYWLVGTAMGSGWGSWPNSGNRVPAGRLLVLDDEAVYGFGRFNQYHRDGAHVGLGRVRYYLYAAPLSGGEAEQGPQAKRRAGQQPPEPSVASRWTRPLPLLARAMVLSGETLFVAGPPDVFVYAPEDSTDAYHVASVEALREQEAALAGQRGGLLLAVSAADGEQLAEYKLDSPPAWDAIAAAGGRLYLATLDGRLVCLEGERAD